MDEAMWHDSTGQLVFCGAKAVLTIGDCKTSDKMPEGTIIPCVVEKADICGSMARTSNASFMIVGHADDERTIRVHLLWSRKTLMSTCRATVGTVSYTTGHPHTACSNDSKKRDAVVMWTVELWQRGFL